MNYLNEEYRVIIPHVFKGHGHLYVNEGLEMAYRKRTLDTRQGTWNVRE